MADTNGAVEAATAAPLSEADASHLDAQRQFVVRQSLEREAALRKQCFKVAIVAKAPSSMALAPFHDPTWQIWSLGDNWRNIPRVHDNYRWFEIHDIDDGFSRWPHDFQDWLRADHNMPLYIHGRHPQIPHALEFPYQEIERLFREKGFAGYRYFNNSISWFMAFALWERLTNKTPLQEVALYGVDMAQHGLSFKTSGEMGSSEYAHQRPSCEYWIGLLEGHGIKVTKPPQSDLLTVDRRYAIDSCGSMGPKVDAKKKEVMRRIQEAQNQIATAQANMHTLQGALTGLNWREQGDNGEQLDAQRS